MISSGSALFATINKLLIMGDNKKKKWTYIKLYFIQAPFHFLIMGAKAEIMPIQHLPKLDLESLLMFCIHITKKPSKVT